MESASELLTRYQTLLGLECAKRGWGDTPKNRKKLVQEVMDFSLHVSEHMKEIAQIILGGSK